MCDIITGLAVIGTVAGVGGQVAAGKAAKKNAEAQRAYNLEVERKQKVYRREVISYQNAQYANDIDFYNKNIAHAQGQFADQLDYANDQIDAIDNDFFGMLSTQMTKVVEQNMAESFGLINTAKEVRTETGALETRMADSGVGGNVSAALRGDIQRQGGDASNMASINTDRLRIQTDLETRAISGQRDNSLASIRIQPFQPIAPPAPPAPVNPIQAAAPQQRISSAAIFAGAVGSGITMGMQAGQFASAVNRRFT